MNSPQQKAFEQDTSPWPFVLVGQQSSECGYSYTKQSTNPRDRRFASKIVLQWAVVHWEPQTETFPLLCCEQEKQLVKTAKMKEPINVAEGAIWKRRPKSCKRYYVQSVTASLCVLL